MDGKPAAATVVARKRSVFYGVLGYAVELDILPANPIDKVRWKTPATAGQIGRRVVASPTQITRLLDAVAAQKPELVAFFACLYYAYLRPAEAAALTISSCALPGTGWGRLTLTGTAKRVPAGWTDDGTGLDQRQLKHRARDAVRVVPIPPVLVSVLRDHISRFGTAADGRLFQVTWGQRGTGGVVTAKVYGHVWQKARAATLTKAQQASPLAARPYDLRHGGITLALNAGVPAPEVATRAGHSVECPVAGLRRLRRRPRPTLEPSHRRSPHHRRPKLFRACSENTRQKPGTAGNSRHRTRTAPDHEDAVQGLFHEVVAGVGFEPT